MCNSKISVIVPVYNAEKYLDQGITSLIEQTHHNLEIILIDDCSTDGSLAILEKYAKQDERIILIKMNRNSGVSACRNAGLDIVTGDYLAFMDADDWYEKNAMESMFKTLSSARGDLCIGAFFVEKGDTSTLYQCVKNPSAPRDGKVLLNPTEAFFRLEFAMWAILCKLNDSNRKLRFIDNSPMGEDAVYKAELIFNADKIVCTDCPIYHYRVLEQSASHGMSAKHATIVKGLYEGWLGVFREHDVLEKLKMPFLNYALSSFDYELKLTPQQLQLQLIADMQNFLKQLDCRCPSRLNISVMYCAYKLCFLFRPLKIKLKIRYNAFLKLRYFYERFGSC